MTVLQVGLMGAVPVGDANGRWETQLVSLFGNGFYHLGWVLD